MTAANLIDTRRFGQIECKDSDLVTFRQGLVGFPDRTRFMLIQHDPESPFHWLQSVEDGNLAFLVADPAIFVKDYAPEMPDATAEFLELKEDTPRLVYTIVNIPRGQTSEMTINLAGPIIVNVETGEATQVILEDDSYSIRHRVFGERVGKVAA